MHTDTLSPTDRDKLQKRIAQIDLLQQQRVIDTIAGEVLLAIASRDAGLVNFESLLREYKRTGPAISARRE